MKLKHSIISMVLLISVAFLMHSQPTSATFNASPFVAYPFVAADKETTTAFKATLVSAPGSPFAVRVNTYPVPKGTYSGVELLPNAPYVNLQNITFRLSGPQTTQVTVHSQGRATSKYTGCSAGEGMKSSQVDNRGFQLVSLDASQLGIDANSAIDNIVISTDEGEKNASFAVKDMQVDGQPVTKSVQYGTHFYNIVGGRASGPKGTASLQTAGLPTNPTQVSVTNSAGHTRYFYINLLLPSQNPNTKYPPSWEVQSLSNLSSTTTGPNFEPGTTEGQITNINPTQGWFYLQSSDKVTFASSPSNLTFSAQIFTNGTGPKSTVWPDDNQCITNVNASHVPVQGTGVGATFAEFTINGAPPLSPDTADISEVNGVNALYMIRFPKIPQNAYPDFFCCSSYLFHAGTHTPWGNFNQGQYIPVPYIANNPGTTFPFTGDANGTLYPVPRAEAMPGGPSYDEGTVGVYPFGCDVCTASKDPGCTGGNYSGTQGQYNSICQVSRPIANLGGTVEIKLIAFPNQ